MRLLFVLSFLGFIATTLSACHTTRGIGQDVQATGRAVERAATP